MLAAALYGLLASSGLLIGAFIGLVTSPSRRAVAAVIAFGSGVLVSALTFELMQEAAERGHLLFASLGFLVGAVVYVGTSWGLDRMAAKSPRRSGRHPRDVEPGAAAVPEPSATAAVSGTALLVGAILDGIPENLAIGISVRAEGRAIGWVLLIAVLLGNLPESISSAVGMRQEGRSPGYIMGVWGAATAACTLATVLGYVVLGGLSPDHVAAVLAVAAGGILAMLADTMMPEAFENGGPLVALATACGFLCAFLLSHLAF